MDKKTKRGHRAQNQEDPSSLAAAVRCALCGLLLSLAAAIVTLVLASVYALSRPDPEGLVLSVASILPYPCAILGGFISSKLFKGTPALAAAAYAAMLLLLSIALFPLLHSTYEAKPSALSFFIMRGLLIGCCIAGTLLGKMSPSVKRSRRRRHR